MNPRILAVSRSAVHKFSKQPQTSIRLIKDFGIEGDAHAGMTTQHLYLKKKNAALPNLCQVHLLQSELFDELRAKGFDIHPGDVGENVTTRGIDLLALPEGALLHLGKTAIVGVSGVRTPCALMNRFRKGLMQATLEKAPDGTLVRKAGIMSVVIADGEVRAGDAVRIVLPEGPHRPLKPV